MSFIVDTHQIEIRYAHFSVDFKWIYHISSVGCVTAVGSATCYGLDGPGSSRGGGREFPYPSRPALGPTQPPIE